MPQTCLVTGATGFIGNHLVKALSEHGFHIKCLVVPKDRTDHLRKLGVELIAGDIQDKGSLAKAVKGVNRVYHLAAHIRPTKAINHFHAQHKLYQNINVAGTRNLADVCLGEGIQRFIYFSSFEAVGLGKEITEQSSCQPVTDYGRSKLEAEKYILGLSRDKNFPALVIRPGIVYGPGNMSILPLFRLAKRKLIITIDHGANLMPFCFIDDLVRGVLMADSHGRDGSIYNISGKACTFREFINTICATLATEPIILNVSHNLIKKVARVKETIEKMSRLSINPFLVHFNKDTVCLMHNDCNIMGDKSKKEFGYVPQVEIREGVYLTVKWYKQQGLL
ncbi:MAG: NAD-dependent epimerase/dehydratase family protein [Candidatus Omnitrophica bacterium]|nr:NAD-dependent epimerase/dehydratase family protein [Candidatus Omnitrophota bacterium]MDD5609959.1 NAD-dependent epimerase/dehydratase family protein [Candidatus Omnitrophota bacterium]